MPTPVNIGTRDIPLQFARRLTDLVNTEIKNGTFLDKLTPVTRDLYRYWFEDIFCENRRANFHIGQRQAILNTIYVHEILKTSNVFDTYSLIDQELLAQMDLVDLKRPKYQYPKYAIKMATGTGKTWVMQAILIWQYLNAKHEEAPSGKYSKNFLLVAPGLIIYERLLNALLGKENEQGVRNFDRSDIKQSEELFIPQRIERKFLGLSRMQFAVKRISGAK